MRRFYLFFALLVFCAFSARGTTYSFTSTTLQSYGITKEVTADIVYDGTTITVNMTLVVTRTMSAYDTPDNRLRVNEGLSATRVIGGISTNAPMGTTTYTGSTTYTGMSGQIVITYGFGNSSSMAESRQVTVGPIQPKQNQNIIASKTSSGASMVQVAESWAITGNLSGNTPTVTGVSGCNVIVAPNGTFLVTPTETTYQFRINVAGNEQFNDGTTLVAASASPFVLKWKFNVGNPSDREIRYRVIQGSSVLQEGFLWPRMAGTIQGTAPNPSPDVQLQYLSEWVWSPELQAWIKRTTPVWETVQTTPVKDEQTDKEATGNVPPQGVPPQSTNNSTEWKSVDEQNKTGPMDKGTFVEGISKVESAIRSQASGLADAAGKLDTASGKMTDAANSMNTAASGLDSKLSGLKTTMDGVKETLDKNGGVTVQTYTDFPAEAGEDSPALSAVPQDVLGLSRLLPAAPEIPIPSPQSAMSFSVPFAAIGGAGGSVATELDLAKWDLGINIFKALARVGMAIAFYFAIVREVRSMFAG